MIIVECIDGRLIKPYAFINKEASKDNIWLLQRSATLVAKKADATGAIA